LHIIASSATIVPTTSPSQQSSISSITALGVDDLLFYKHFTIIEKKDSFTTTTADISFPSCNCNLCLTLLPFTLGY
jgi:hypothetical protein